ncbi:hypothetical protein T040910_104 [Synechococcus phage S-CAM3]|uniref:Uncharacterized protein n=1 Tax=Synechococcus phage S-CAM3 TaxID=1883366 RepID=A0A1D8KKF6_9CAUD|nr:hypothetical protein BOW87_gp154 [Synechococcus phage S-CAM3]AOV58609.1 hypothetical protein S250808_104 [Synechococcus phage S-CAM3]AOV58848.1 hypothetical protein T040910_104 [Synechococcus phage S-CAM3]AOV59087.1 hypothetical protein C421010_104 [Synechococcus phage S-CAM3]
MRPKSFFINGGAGRVICSIPALEKYQEDHPDEDFVIVCEGGSDFFRGHPTLYSKVYDHWHKNLFQDKLKDTDICTPEPYRVWEYYNQKCNLSQAFDIAINNKGIRDLPDPRIKLTREESVRGKMIVAEVRSKTEKKKTVVFQPFGRGVTAQGNLIYDSSGRSFEYYNAVSIVRRLQKKYSVIWFSELPLDVEGLGLKDTVSIPASQQVDLRTWAGIIREADLVLGCDSVGQHIAKSMNKPAVVVVGSTFAENITYPNWEKFDILDMGEGQRVYDPIRISMDDESNRTNDGIMAMNDKVEEVIIKSVDKLMNKYYRKPEHEVILPQEWGCGSQGCDTPQAPIQEAEPKKEKPNIFSDMQVTQDAVASKPPGFSNSVKIAK